MGLNPAVANMADSGFDFVVDCADFDSSFEDSGYAGGDFAGIAIGAGRDDCKTDMLHLVGRASIHAMEERYWISSSP